MRPVAVSGWLSIEFILDDLCFRAPMALSRICHIRASIAHLRSRVWPFSPTVFTRTHNDACFYRGFMPCNTTMPFGGYFIAYFRYEFDAAGASMTLDAIRLSTRELFRSAHGSEAYIRALARNASPRSAAHAQLAADAGVNGNAASARRACAYAY